MELAAGFPQVSYDEWMEQVAGVLLRGRPDPSPEEIATAFEKRLVHRDEDGIEVRPLYTAADAEGLRPAPWARGDRTTPDAWEIRQRVRPGTAIEELENGSTGLLAVAPDDVDELDEMFDGVHLELAPVSLEPTADANRARLLLDLWDRRSVPTEERHGTLGFDPVGASLREGHTDGIDDALAAAAALVSDVRVSAPGSRALVVDGAAWHELGATPVQEIAWATSQAVDLVRALSAAGPATGLDVGLDVEHVSAAVEFRFASTVDQFGTIAKLRAARRVWARVVELAGGSAAAAAQVQHALTARSMLSLYDPWVNALRNTVACFAAGVGGASAVTVEQHDLLTGGSALGRRLARNTQSVLQMESNLARVADVAGGSWYVERLTDELARAAWSQLQQIDDSGGFAAFVASGETERHLAEARAGRDADVATRVRPLTGLTEFPDLDEVAAGPADEGGTEDHRLGSAVEQVRLRADASARSGSRPSVFLATLGTEAVHTPRLTFSQNFFGVGGIVGVVGPVEAYDPSISPIVCLCSSDAVYAEDGGPAVEALRSAGARRVLVAGRSTGVPGIDGEIGLGTDVVDVLGSVLDQLLEEAST